MRNHHKGPQESLSTIMAIPCDPSGMGIIEFRTQGSTLSVGPTFSERMDSPMCQTSTSHHSIFCILPPHILRRIAQSGGPRQRAWALHTLATDNTFRALRANPRAPAPSARRRPSMLAVEGQKQRTIFDAHGTEGLPGDIVRSEGTPPAAIRPLTRPTMVWEPPLIFSRRRTIGTRSTMRAYR
jgi:hypothetical protein